MVLSQFKFLTDENIPHRVVAWLREAGFDVYDIKDEGLATMADEDILPIAETQKRVIITQDSDLGTILFKLKLRQSGVIFLRPGHVKADTVISTLKKVFEQPIEAELPFILVIEAKNDVIKMRLRQL